MRLVVGSVSNLLIVAMFASCSSDSSDAAAGEGSDADGTTADVDGSASGPEDDATDDSTDGPQAIEQSVFNDTRISSNDGEGRNVRRADAPVSFDGGPFESATLRVQLATTCFPFEDWTTPPAGHNWPADCDAFDRNFEFTLDEPTGEGQPPAWELVRAITPFGGPMEFEVDLTDLANTLQGQHTISVAIATYSDGQGIVSGSDGGWNVTADLELVPGTPPRNVLAATPLVNLSLTTDTNLQPVPFSIPDGARSAYIEYRTTGHGGGEAGRDCIGPAEEFCQRDHTVFIDEEPFWFARPWRDSCEEFCTLQNNGRIEFCLQNPCGSIASVRAPRANWCPGDVTPPEEIWLEADQLSGEHTFRFEVANLAPGGSWRTSATLFVYGEPE
jgi:hypothetical protein